MRINDPREILADKLTKAGIDVQKAFFIVIDVGRNLVDKEYLIDLGLKGEKLNRAENVIKDYYWENNVFD
ncbi:MAG TPA: hypothetical protein PL134_02940 [Smithellaceae bacterium]|jgi:2-phosphoglycerate kinase|nr:MAG: hypothetical protein BWY90_00937 [Deltaproteobacteria bacterium ADurb.BinA014]HNQ18398.1 hypothetical protein [Smithellaceae bacterium]HNT92017.1 hypothetical protein [Smithellaceae bacterium]HNV64588.1 hypothetical protein [Smithellaceae bacterium]HNZ31828.1 hypothetical protein [Smithellaceae bacterium]